MGLVFFWCGFGCKKEADKVADLKEQFEGDDDDKVAEDERERCLDCCDDIKCDLCGQEFWFGDDAGEDGEREEFCHILCHLPVKIGCEAYGGNDDDAEQHCFVRGDLRNDDKKGECEDAEAEEGEEGEEKRYLSQ